MDKASVLGEAARYVKQLQEQVKELEDQKSSKRVSESVVIARSPKMNSSIEDGNMSSSSSSNDNVESSSLGNHSLPEIEARFSNKDVLIRVHCMKKQGIVPKLLDEIQKFRLSIINCNSMPFGRSTVVVTIVAEVLQLIYNKFVQFLCEIVIGPTDFNNWLVGEPKTLFLLNFADE